MSQDVFGVVDVLVLTKLFLSSPMSQRVKVYLQEVWVL